MKARIGVSWLVDGAVAETDKRSLAYLESVRRTGAEAVYLPLVKSEEEAEELLNGIDGLLLTGGDDIDPTLYNEENLYCEDLDQIRDVSDVILLKAAIRRDMPVLCICRGVQMLNVVCGGTLYQDLGKQNPTAVTHRDPEAKVYVSHPIRVEEDSLLFKAINSTECHYKGWHHQAVKDVGAGLKVTAVAEDGGVEAIELVTATYVYGVQAHPERYTVEEAQDASDLFLAFAKQCALNK